MSTLQEALKSYLDLRRGLGTSLHGPAARLRRFVEFLDHEGAAIITTELALRWATAPVDVMAATRAQRLGDVRRFAVTLVRWYREGRDVERELPKLSAYLGHAHVADTYWYIEAIPELLQLATDRATGPQGEAP